MTLRYIINIIILNHKLTEKPLSARITRERIRQTVHGGLIDDNVYYVLVDKLLSVKRTNTI